MAQQKVTGNEILATSSLTIGSATISGDSTINGLTIGKGGGAVGTNTVVGISALQNNSSGTNHAAFGTQALQANTTGAENSAFGLYSLLSNTTGSNNAAFGRGALQSNTTASYNTAVGFQSGYTNSTGAYNTFLGTSAGYTSTGSQNTCIGMHAGYSLTTGTGNTFVGQYVNAGAGGLITTGSNNTIIGGYDGTNGGLNITTSSNYIVLSDGAGNPWWSLNGGTGTTSMKQYGYATITPVMRVSGFGYSPGSYRAIVLGGQTLAGTYNTVCIGYDPYGNTNGSFSGTGSEVIFQNAASFITPNSANTSFQNQMAFNTNGYGVKFFSSIGVGRTDPASTGAGVSFPATQSASSDANTLDDYEEGTWTPTLTTSGTAPTGVGYAYRSATYTKIGNTVICKFGIKLNALSTAGSGEITITGFPFTSANYGAWQEPPATLKCYNFASTTTLSNGIASYFASSSTQIYFRTGNSDTPIDASQLTSIIGIGATVVYQVA